MGEHVLLSERCYCQVCFRNNAQYNIAMKYAACMNESSTDFLLHRTPKYDLLEVRFEKRGAECSRETVM